MLQNMVIELLKKNFCDENCRKKITLKFEAYVDLIVEWSKTHNVISRSMNVDGIWLEIYDSISCYDKIKKHFNLLKISSQDIVDAGAGGGFPSIPLSIMFQDNNFVLVDASRKKCSFLRTVKAALNLTNISIAQQRLETLAPSNIIITKAAFSPNKASILVHAIKSNGMLIIWSSVSKSEDFNRVLAPHGLHLRDKWDYDLAGQKKCCLMFFVKTAD